jgi:hypothetical protein
VKQATTALERVAIVVASLVLAVGLIAILSGFFAGRDQAGVAGPVTNTVGQTFPDQGDAHLGPGQPHPVYNSNPPTSGAHIPEPILLDRNVLNDDQLLEALEVGDVVIMYGTKKPSPTLAALARSLGGRFSPALAASGQAVVLAKRPGTQGLIALAWTKLLRVRSAGDPALKQFVSQRLGRGASGH